MIFNQAIANKAVWLASSYCTNGEWLYPEYALAGVVVAHGMVDAVSADDPKRVVAGILPWAVAIDIQPRIIRALVSRARLERRQA